MNSIALYDVDSKIPNLALMKISAYHKNLGDKVSWYSPLLKGTYDKIYCSKVFSFSDNGYISKDMIQGGSGIDLEAKLPDYIEHIYPDYSLYPNCDYALGFLTRGCIRKCPFCIVWKKEGNIQFNAHLTEFCKDQEKVRLLDNNILAYPKHEELLQELIESRKRIDFNQGLDIRLITEENAKLLKQIKIWKQLRFSLDDVKLIPIMKEKLEILRNAGLNPRSFCFYVLIGFNSTYKEDLERVKFLYGYKSTIYIMPFNQRNKNNKYIRDFKRWVSQFFYKYISFEDYVKSSHISLVREIIKK